MPAITGKIRLRAATNHAILRNLRSIRSRRASICKMASSISRSMDATLRRWQQPQKDAGNGDDFSGAPGNLRRPSQGLCEQGAPRWRSSSKSRDHRSCSSLPKACDRAPGWRELERRGAGGATCGNFWDWGDRVWPGFCGVVPDTIVAPASGDETDLGSGVVGEPLAGRSSVRRCRPPRLFQHPPRGVG